MKEPQFAILGPDRNGLVWISSTDPRNDWRQCLADSGQVAAVMSRWLGSVDYDESEEHGE